jgi:glycine hydroxymethyltransferase
MVLCNAGLKEVVDKGCPLVLGGPLPHVIAAKLIAFQEARAPSFNAYAQQIVSNAKALAGRLVQKGIRLTTGGTDNHLMVLDISSTLPLTGRQAEQALRSAGMTVNRNSLPGDKNGAWYTSGVRLGTPALTTRGMKEREMELIADFIVELLQQTQPATGSRSEIVLNPTEIEKRVQALLGAFPLYPELLID